MKDLFHRPVKVSAKEDQVFFWSDMHLGHRCANWQEPLYVKRGFSTMEEHDAALVSRWNARLTSRSTVFNLGDMLFGHDGERRLMEYFDSLAFGTMYLLFGNHTAGMRQVFDSLDGNVLELGSGKRVVFCPSYMEAWINGFPCVLSHYAVASFNGQGMGAFMIHGHSHGSLKNSELGKLLYKARVVDVGVENFPSPVSFGEIKALFRGDPISFDHH